VKQALAQKTDQWAPDIPFGPQLERYREGKIRTPRSKYVKGRRQEIATQKTASLRLVFDVITIGSATQDVFARSQDIKVVNVKEFVTGKAGCFPLGAKLDLDELYFFIGGGAVNTAITFVNQGLRTAAIASIGRDERGEHVLKAFNEHGISPEFLQVDPEHLTSFSIIFSLKDGSRTIFQHEGAVWNFDKKAIPWKTIRSKWFYVNHLGGKSASLVSECIVFAKKKGIQVALNPGRTQFKNKKELIPLLNDIDVFIVNQEEACLLTGISYEKKKEIFQQLDDWVQGIVVMTQGPKGVEVSDGKTIWSAGILEAKKVIDRTGAGDAFGAGFVAGLIRKPGDIEYAMQLASSNATGVLGEWGATNGLLQRGASPFKWGRLEIQETAL